MGEVSPGRELDQPASLKHSPAPLTQEVLSVLGLKGDDLCPFQVATLFLSQCFYKLQCILPVIKNKAINALYGLEFKIHAIALNLMGFP